MINGPAQIRIASWNAEARLSPFNRPGRYVGSPEQIIKGITMLDDAGIDFLFVPEAFDGDRPIDIKTVGDLKQVFKGRNHFAVELAYEEDMSGREFSATCSPYMMAMGRVGVKGYNIFRQGGIRNGMDIEIEVPGSSETVRILGVHLDDRNEANRKKQAHELIDRLGESPRRTVVLGDFNTTTGEGLVPRLLDSKMARNLARAVPFSVVRDMAVRLTDMNSGDALRMLIEETGLQRANPDNTPTITLRSRGVEMLPPLGVIGIDHILHTPDLRVEDFRVWPYMGSDHRAISATLSLR